MSTKQAQPIERRNTVPAALKILKISRPTFYVRVAEGKLKIVKDGARSFVSGEELERYLTACESES